MDRLRTAFQVLVTGFLLLLFSSWDGEWDKLLGPIPPMPLYDDSLQWYIHDQNGVADVFYVISTETGDHLEGEDTCYFANTLNPMQRKQMLKEMHAVDSFYTGELNYFSPYYRQISIQSWADMNTAMTRIPLAISDVKRSWLYYLEHLNQGRPFILAGFSQGAHALMEIMKDRPDRVAERMVAAYVIGYKVTQENLDSCSLIKPAKGATDTGVTICYNSADSPEAEIGIVSGGNLFCINPVNWRTDSVSSQFVMRTRRGSDTMTVHVDSASRLLIVDGFRDKRPMPVIGVPGNYHHMELKLYYPYIRQNMADRVAAFLERKEQQTTKN